MNDKIIHILNGLSLIFLKIKSPLNNKLNNIWNNVKAKIEPNMREIVFLNIIIITTPIKRLANIVSRIDVNIK